MKPSLPSYTETSGFLDERPDIAADWQRLALLAACGFFVTLAVHFLEAPAWNVPSIMVAGERILATHDAYCWLAGAKGVNGYAGQGMSGLAALLSAVTGAPLWRIGFWAPPFLAGLTAVFSGLWGWLLGGRRAAIVPGLLGALAPAFFYRSRLGYYDSDSFTELMPLVLSFGLALLLLPCCARAWRPTDAERRDQDAAPGWLPWLALGFGLVARVAHFAHDDVHPLGIGLFWLALGLLALTGLPGKRVAALRLLVIYGLAAYAGPRRFGLEVFQPGLAELPGLVLAAALAWLCHADPQRLPAAAARLLARWFDRPWPWLAALGLMTLSCGLLLPLGAGWAKALTYAKPVADAGAGLAAGPKYPGITQSVREAANVANWGLLFNGVSASFWTAAAGALGILALLVLRPSFLLLLPMLALAVSSLKLGSRFTMFGGPVFALGLGIGAHWLGKALLRRLGRDERPLAFVQVLLALACLALAYVPAYLSMKPTPVLGAPHAKALLHLRQDSPKDAEVWTWWDYGYATQYFAERMTPTDGGRHAGRDIFPTALVLTTPSFRQAAQLILFSASQGNDLARRWDTMPATAVMEELEGLAARDQTFAPARPQLLVVSWESLLLLYWISFYGSWDLVSGTGSHAKVMSLSEPYDLDYGTGRLTYKKDGKALQLASAETVSLTGSKRFPLPEHPGGPHLVINDHTRQALLFDDVAYNSMAVQLLLGDPDRPEQARSFKLLHEGFPLVRIYEVLPRIPEPAPQAKAEQP